MSDDEESPPDQPLPEACCAVVVTFNRKDLLRECLHALLGQTHPIAHALVIDNASTDGTPEMLAAEFPKARFPQIESVRLAVNSGGAGGFRAGMERAAALGFDWFWLMDDDTIVEPDSLAALLAARARLAAADTPPLLLASKVVWTDGSLHAMNSCSVKYGDWVSLVAAAGESTLAIRTATFVSLLVHRDAAARHGLPWADYFIWGDDTEWTARVLRQEFGVFVPASRVLHKTVLNHTALDAAPAKFYYHVRNELWMFTRSSAWTAPERLKRLVALLRFIVSYLRRNRSSLGEPLRSILRGVWHGLFHKPTH